MDCQGCCILAPGKHVDHDEDLHCNSGPEMDIYSTYRSVKYIEMAAVVKK